MPLSRHFYSLDEVQAAIVYTGSRGIPQETVFWCREAVESGCVAEAIACLFESWLWHRGPFAMEWLVDAQRLLGGAEVTAEDVERMAERLSRCRVKDDSLWWLFVRQGEAVDRVTPRSPARFPSEEERETFFVRAVYQGKARSAWWAGSAFSVERWWWLVEWYRDHVVPEEERGMLQRDIDALRGYEGLLGYASEGYDRAVRGAVLLRLCRRGVAMAVAAQGDQKEPATQILLPRTLPIPSFALYGVCRRGRMRQRETTMGDLWNVFEGMEGSPYWEEIRGGLEVKEGLEIRGGREVKGGGWDAHFPNDLPDEWSASEKEKSHGAGVLRDGEQVTLWGYTRRYMMGRARLVWPAGTMTPIQQGLERVIWDEGMSPFVALVQGMEQTGVGAGACPLPPVHKKRVVGVGV